MDTQPLSGLIGAEITGIDLNAPIGEAAAEALRNALARHQVLIFPEQFLELQAQKRLTELFGPLMASRYIEPMEGEPYVIRVLKEPQEGGGVFGGAWHSDLSFLAEPPAGSVLAAVELPPYGGDTLWASQVAAWKTLPEPLKLLLEGRDAIHVGSPYGVKWAPPEHERAGGSIRMVRGDPEADEERRHPAVHIIKRTGEQALGINAQYVVRLDGLTEAESKPVLDQINAHAIRPELCYRHRWRPGDVAIWDNRATQHYAVNDYHGFRRLMHRTTFGPR